MNYLAHLFLAEDTPESRIGSLAGDFVKGRLDEALAPAVRQAIVEHRRIDAFTDGHPEVMACRRLLADELGHYTRIVIDVFFDHLLAADFERYSSEPLPLFLEHVYGQIDSHVEHLPGRLRNLYPRMRDEQWLLSYTTIGGIEIALTNISRRLSRRPRLERAIPRLVAHRTELSHHFHAFFPEVIGYTLRLRADTPI